MKLINLNPKFCKNNPERMSIYLIDTSHWASLTKGVIFQANTATKRHLDLINPIYITIVREVIPTVRQHLDSSL